MAGLRSLLRYALVVPACLALVVPAFACPFCSSQGQTLVGEVKDAAIVLFGTLENAKLPSDESSNGSTDLRIAAVLKNHDVVGDKKVVSLPRFLPYNDRTGKYLVFCGLSQGKVDPYRCVAVKSDNDMVKYLQGALAAKDKSAAERLRFAFDYLDNADLEIANDAYKEFANADYRDYRVMAKNLPADKIAQWLEDPETPTFRFGLYGSLLGHCGHDQHAALLRKLLEQQRKRLTSGLDGLLAGYTMIQPKEGWAFIRSVLNDPKKDFMFRYAALRSSRFFWEYRADLVSHDEIVKGVAQILEQGDIADLAIEDLRKWSRWDVADKILDMGEKNVHEVPIVRRAILRYALSCKDNARATDFVHKQRQKDPEAVNDAEELLKLEIPKPNLAK